MGACQTDIHYESNKVFNPLEIRFKQIHPIALPPLYTQFLDTIKQITQFSDARQNIGLKWFYSSEYDLYLYGELEGRKPVGNCLFYIKTVSPLEELPAIVCTSIDHSKDHASSFSPKTLLIYPDKSYYIGSIESKIGEPPKASGKGVLITRKFIYEGWFKNGLPHGLGTFRSKAGTLVGEFEEGEPHGKCVERSKKGLFVGELMARFRKNGKLITANNTVELVNEEFAHKNQMMVEL